MKLKTLIEIVSRTDVDEKEPGKYFIVFAGLSNIFPRTLSLPNNQNMSTGSRHAGVLHHYVRQQFPQYSPGYPPHYTFSPTASWLSNMANLTNPA